jgi:DNA repair protein RadA
MARRAKTEEDVLTMEDTIDMARKTDEEMTNDDAEVVDADVPTVKAEKTLADLPGVGPKTVEKLEEAGYGDMMAVATASAAEIAAVADMGEGAAAKVIAAARQALEMGFETGTAALQRRMNVGKISTGSQALNDLLGGGVETGSITECYGAFGSSKTQLGHQLAVHVQLPKEEGGLNGGVLWIDTESTFRPERIKQMAEAIGKDPEQILKNIYVGKAFNSDHQILLVDKAKEMIKEKNIKLIVVDSLTAHFRSDYVGRGALAGRQQKLNQHLHTLQRLADSFNCAVYITNQVMANPGMLFGDPTTAVGGHVLHHAATYRIYLRRSKDNLRIAKLVDSPNLPDGETIFKITTEGLRDK